MFGDKGQVAGKIQEPHRDQGDTLDHITTTTTAADIWLTSVSEKKMMSLSWNTAKWSKWRRRWGVFREKINSIQAELDWGEVVGE